MELIIKFPFQVMWHFYQLFNFLVIFLRSLLKFCLKFESITLIHSPTFITSNIFVHLNSFNWHHKSGENSKLKGSNSNQTQCMCNSRFIIVMRCNLFVHLFIYWFTQDLNSEAHLRRELIIISCGMASFHILRENYLFHVGLWQDNTIFQTIYYDKKDTLHSFHRLWARMFNLSV